MLDTEACHLIQYRAFTTHNSSLVPAVHSEGRSDGEKNAWFQLFAHAQNFQRNVFYCGVLPHNGHCSDTDDKFSSALVLCIIYPDEGYSY